MNLAALALSQGTEKALAKETVTSHLGVGILEIYQLELIMC